MPADSAGGLVEEDPPLLVGGRGRAAPLLAEVDAALDRWAIPDRRAPARNIGKFVERLAQRLRYQHPRPARHVDDRIIADDEFAALQPALQDAEAAIVFVGIALVRIGVPALGVIDEMAELAGHRPEIADLPEQPFRDLLTGAPTCRQKPTAALGQMQEDGARFKYTDRSVRIVVIDDRRHPVVRADREELRLELVALADIDRDDTVFEGAFLQHDADLPAIRRRPVIKIDQIGLIERNSGLNWSPLPILTGMTRYSRAHSSSMMLIFQPFGVGQ